MAELELAISARKAQAGAKEFTDAALDVLSAAKEAAGGVSDLSSELKALPNGTERATSAADEWADALSSANAVAQPMDESLALLRDHMDTTAASTLRSTDAIEEWQQALASAQQQVPEIAESSEAMADGMKKSADAAGQLSGRLGEVTGRGERTSDLFSLIIRKSPQLLAADLLARVIGFRNMMDLLNSTLDALAGGIVNTGKYFLGIDRDLEALTGTFVEAANAMEELQKANRGVTIAFGDVDVYLDDLQKVPEAVAAVQKHLQVAMQSSDPGKNYPPGLQWIGRIGQDEELAMRSIETLGRQLNMVLDSVRERVKVREDYVKSVEKEKQAEEQRQRTAKSADEQIDEMVRSMRDEATAIDFAASRRTGQTAALQAEAIARRGQIPLLKEERDLIIQLGNEIDRRSARAAKINQEQSEIDSAVDGLKAYTEALDEEVRMLDMSDRQRRIRIETVRLLKLLEDSQTTASEEQLKEWHDKIILVYGQQESAAAQAAERMTDVFGQAALQVIRDWDSAGDAVKAVWDQLITEMFQELVFAPFKKSIFSLFENLFLAVGFPGAPTDAPGSGGLDLPDPTPKSASSYGGGLGQFEGATSGASVIQKSSAPVTLNFYLSGVRDYDSFRRSERQIVQLGRRAAAEIRG